ncbi:MAG: hypothetical protein ACJAWL_002683 [Motiliproteus sp.]|jgi:hypothetical protein
MSLFLLQSTINGQPTRVVLPLTDAIEAIDNANYSLIDDATGKPPADLKLLKDGDDLIITESGKPLTKIENFFAENIDATFATDGSALASEAASDSLIHSTTEVATGVPVWESAVAEAVASTSVFGWGVLAPLGVVAGGAVNASVPSPQHLVTVEEGQCRWCSI